jgi:hypothetical protein
MRPYSSLDPLPRLIRREKDCRGFAQGHPVTNESNKPSLEVLGSLQDGHKLHGQVDDSAECVARFDKEVGLEFLQGPGDLLKLRDLGLVAPHPLLPLQFPHLRIGVASAPFLDCCCHPRICLHGGSYDARLRWGSRVRGWSRGPNWWAGSPVLCFRLWLCDFHRRYRVSAPPS